MGVRREKRGAGSNFGHFLLQARKSPRVEGANESRAKPRQSSAKANFNLPGDVLYRLRAGRAGEEGRERRAQPPASAKRATCPRETPAERPAKQSARSAKPSAKRRNQIKLRTFLKGLMATFVRNLTCPP